MADKSKATRALFIIFVEPPREAPTGESRPGREARKVLPQSDVLNLYLDMCDREAVNDMCDREAVNDMRDREAVNDMRDREAVNETWRAAGAIPAAGSSAHMRQIPLPWGKNGESARISERGIAEGITLQAGWGAGFQAGLREEP